MGFKIIETSRIRLPYFASGSFYSAEADRRRFLYLDYNLESYVGIIGVGLIDGWTITEDSGLSVKVSYGTAIINECFSESPFVVKNHADVLPTDYVIKAGYYTDNSTSIVYDQVLYNESISLSDNSDNYIYIYRNSNASLTDPYYEPNNTDPIVETTATYAPLNTAVAFGVSDSKAFAESSGKLLVGSVLTRNGSISTIDTSDIKSLKGLESTIVAFGKKLVDSHVHGGTGEYDPKAINLRTDMRDCTLESAKESNVVYKILYSDPTSIELGHKHYYMIDSDGNGSTVTLVGSGDFHFHTISEYAVSDPVVQTGTVELHTHTLTLSKDNPDSWNTVGDYQIYINEEPYYGTKATVSVNDKDVTFTGDVIVTKRKYAINKSFGDGSTYTFESEEPSLYRFMLRVSLDYYAKNVDAISAGSKAPLILPDPASPVTLLQNQCIVGEQQLKERGDTFTFTGEVAPDPVTVVLSEAGHIDAVKIELVSNSEVSEKLRAQNVLYIPAEKFTTGTFAIGIIPILSHMGRYLEKCEFESERVYTYDGFIYQLTGTTPWGNAKIVYSVYVDLNQNQMLGTSDGLYYYPYNGSYLFIINGEKIITEYGDLEEKLQEAAREYASVTGETIALKKSIYDPQIALAAPIVAQYGTHYQINGSYKIINNVVSFDVIHIYRIPGYKIPHFGYETTRLDTDILEGEEVIEEVGLATSTAPALAGESSTTTSPKLYKVKNDFNKSTVKKILVESNYVNQYGGLNRIYFALGSDYIAKCTNPNTFWSMTDQSSQFGYIYDFNRTYRGYYIACASTGMYVCLSSTSEEYKYIDLPSYVSDITASTFGFGDLIVMAYKDIIASTNDYGKTWETSDISTTTVLKIFFDPTQDKTDVVLSHYHDLSIDYTGNGHTTNMYDESGNVITETHVHSVSQGNVQIEAEHTHASVRTFYALNDINEIFTSNDGVIWEKYSDIPSLYGEIGLVFACFGKILVFAQEDNIYTYDGLTWQTTNDFSAPIYSAQWDEENELVYFGSENALYSYDGTVLELERTLSGNGIPTVYINGSRKYFNYTLNNYKRKVDFLMGNPNLDPIDVIYDFQKCYPIHGHWSAGISYDLYVNDLLIKSTRDDIQITGDMKADVNNSGYIDFSVVSQLQNPINYGDEYIDVINGSEFPSSGYIRLDWKGKITTESLFYYYTSKQSNRLYLNEPSQDAVAATVTTTTTGTTETTTGTTTSTSNVTVTLVSSLGESDNILITIYEGKIKNVGKNTHYDVEDALSIQNIGSPKTFADVYLSNLMHMTVALKYAAYEVGDDFKNYFLTTFDYNNDPGSEKYIRRFIDVYSSDFFSQVMYASTYYPSFAFKINRIIFGFGTFANKIFVATNIGLYVAKTNLGYEANWFRINIDGETSVHDILQAKDSLIFVCTDKGFYKTTDSHLVSYTKYIEDVIGGIPTRINPRWKNVGAYNNSDQYWWQGWQGVTHSNSNLINSIIVSGLGFCSVTDDYGGIWQKSYITSLVGTNIRENYLLTDLAVLHNGTVVSCLKNVDTELSSIIYSTGNGSSWFETYQFNKYTATVLSYKITDYNNIELEIKYDGEPPTAGKLRGLILSCQSKEFKIINNKSTFITIYGTEIVDLLVGNDTITIKPATLNAISESPDARIVIGTSNGLLTDKGAFLASRDKNAGIISKIGIKGTVDSLNITGTIKAVIFSSTDRTMISTSLDRIVKRNQLINYSLKFQDFTDMTVISNEDSKADGTTTLIVKCDWSTIPTGVQFIAIYGNSRLYITFECLVNPGQLQGGMLYLNPEVSDTTLTKAAVTEYEVVANGVDYIDIKSGTTIDDISNLKETFTTGTIICCSLSDKTVPLFVNFSEIPQPGSLKGSTITFQDISNNLDEATFLVSDNTEVVVYIPLETIATMKDTEGNTKKETFITYNCVFDTNTFTLRNPSFRSEGSFNLKSTSTDSDHIHSLNLYSKYVSGKITSLGENTAVYVDLNVEEIPDFNLSPFVGRPALLEGQDMIIYDPQNYSRNYTVKIISSTSTKIRVRREGDIFNFSGTEPMKISADFEFKIDASLYGITNGIQFSSNFICRKEYLTANTYIEGITFYVQDTSSFSIGETVVIRDRDGLEFRTTVASIPTSTSFTVVDQATFDFKTSKNAYYESLYTKLSIGQYSLTADAAWNTNTIQISDTSILDIGDSILLRDNRGLLFVSTVSSILSPVSFAVADNLNADFYVSNGSYVYVERFNYSEIHTHVVRNGEFEKVENFSWYKRGYPFSHGHVISPLIKDVADIETMHGKVYVCGNNTKICISDSSGDVWREEVDLENVGEVNPTPSSVQNICSNGKDILFGVDSGSIVYHSTMIPSTIVPLEKPIE